MAIKFEKIIQIILIFLFGSVFKVADTWYKPNFKLTKRR